MKATSDALVYAVTYINLRECDRGADDDSDVGALESIAAMLRSGTREEEDALAAAAERALVEERSGAGREEFIRLYGTWMEDMFGEGWTGNNRR